MDTSSVPLAPAAPQQPKLLDLLRQRIRVLHYSIRTEQAYVDWARRFILFHGKRHPRDMGAVEVTAFLTHLAVERNVAASTQNQAKAAIFFSIKRCCSKIFLGWMRWFRPKRRGAYRWC